MKLQEWENFQDVTKPVLKSFTDVDCLDIHSLLEMMITTNF